jgi:nucleotide-binding universal stress UspA family protein
MFRSVLVPLDGSPFSESALPLAIAIARRAQAGLHVATVYLPIAPMYDAPMAGFENTIGPTLRRCSQEYLETAVKRLAAAGVPVTSSFLVGDVVECLVNKAADIGAGLVVMTTHGRGPVARAWLGSVADALVRRLPIPLLLLRPHEQAPDLHVEPAGPQRILIPLDGSTLAEQILEPTLALGKLWEAEYTLVRIIKPPVLGQPDPDGLAVAYHLDEVVVRELTALHEADRKAAWGYLTDMAELLRRQGLKVQTRLLVHDQAAPAILEEARTLPADLIALATHGRSGLPRLFLGSVADKVIRAAGVPVLVQRPVGG